VSSRDKVVTLAIVGGLLVALGVLTKSWWSAEDGSVKIGLRGARLCVSDAIVGTSSLCTTVSYDLIPRSMTQGSFVTLARFTHYAGLLAAVGLFAHAWLIRNREDSRMAVPVVVACVGTAVLVIATVVNLPDDLGDATFGWSFYITALGLVIGAGAGVPRLIPTVAVMKARDSVTGVRDKLHRASLGPLAELTEGDRPDPKQVPRARVVDAGESPTPTPRYDDRLSQARSAMAPAASPRGGLMLGKQRNEAAASVRRVAVDTVAEALRFVARECELNEHGLRVSLRNGSLRQVSWQNIERVVLRCLPPDPPFDNMMMLDVVSRGSSTPVRLLPNTHVNYSALPDGGGMTAGENLRKLAMHAVENSNGGTLDAEPLRFRGKNELLDYDAQYG
jgi:hypothetical protein